MPKYWSADVMRKSDALDLQRGVFTLKNPDAIARSLLKSARNSRRKKASTPLRSAMSMLNFYINRAGKSLPMSRKRILQRSKLSLRRLSNKQRKSKKRR